MTMTEKRVEARLDEITDRLSNISTSLASEAIKFDRLHIRRVRESIRSRPDEKKLKELDVELTMAKRNMDNLRALRDGIEPLVTKLHTARGRVIQLERDLAQRRATTRGLDAFAQVQAHLIEETLPLVDEALEIYGTGGLHKPPSLTALKRQIEGTWLTGSIAALFEKTHRTDRDAGIAETERALAAARRRLVEIADEIDEDE